MEIRTKGEKMKTLSSEESSKKESVWNIIANCLQIYLVSGIFFCSVYYFSLPIGALYPKSLWIYLSSIGLSAVINFILPIPGQRDVKAFQLAAVFGVLTILLSNIGFILTK